MSKQETTEISKILEAIQKDLKEQKAQTDRILSYLENDPTTNQKGLVDDFYLLKDEVKDIVIKEKISLGIKTFLIGLGSFIAFLIQFAYNHFYTQK